MSLGMSKRLWVPCKESAYVRHASVDGEGVTPTHFDNCQRKTSSKCRALRCRFVPAQMQSCLPSSSTYETLFHAIKLMILVNSASATGSLTWCLVPPSMLMPVFVDSKPQRRVRAPELRQAKHGVII